MKKYILLFIVLFTFNYTNAQSNEFIYLKEGKFMEGCDEFYPVVMNYEIDMLVNGTDTFIAPHHAYFNDNQNCTDHDDGIEKLESHFAMMKHMGFNAIRITGFDVGVNRITGHLLMEYDNVQTNFLTSHYQTNFNLIEEFLEIAAEYNLRIIFRLGGGGLEISSVASIYNNYLDLLTARFKNNTTLFAYDLYNEPYYFDGNGDGTYYSKSNTYQYTNGWYNIIRDNTLVQLVTIGLSYDYEVFEWDPSAMNVDFISYHPYAIYDPIRIEKVKSLIKWYSYVIQQPWIVGETSFSGSDETPLPSGVMGDFDDQEEYADTTLKLTRDCGGKGYSWWAYHDVNWGGSLEDYMGLIELDRYGTTTYSFTYEGDSYTVDGDPKPAVSKFQNFNPTNIRTCPDTTTFNYFNPNEYTDNQVTGTVTGPGSQNVVNALIRGWKRVFTGNYLPSGAPIYDYYTYTTYSNSDGEYELNTDQSLVGTIVRIEISSSGLSYDDSDWIPSGISSRSVTLSSENIPILENIYDYGISIPANTTVTWSVPKLIYKELVLGANSTLTIDTSLFLSDDAQIILEPGATLILEDEAYLSSMCPDDGWEGLLHVKENAELYVKDGVTINMGGNGHILIDYANGAAGKLRFFNGGNIILSDYDTKLEIKGDLQLMMGAQFGTAGNGYVLFNSPLADAYCDNLIEGSNTSMDFSGTSSTHKKLEITQPTLYLHGLKDISFNNCKVVMSGTSSRLSLYYATGGSIYLSNINLTSSTGSSSSHRGVALYGQSNTTIQNSDFSYGLYGITALLSYAGAPLTITNCSFTNNSIGLYVYDKGITLASCSFFNNNYGLYADGMTFTSTVSNSSFTYNQTDGIHYTSASTNGLFVDYSIIAANSVNGIWYSGGTKLSVYCGQITSNQRGIYFTGNASLNMSRSESPLSGKVNMSVNTNNNIDAYNGNLLFLNNGYNNLQRNTNKMVISGNLGGYSACPTYLTSQYNRWNASNTSPVYGTDYSLIHNGTCRLKQVYLTDNSPTYTSCSQQLSMPSSSGNDPYGNSSIINTTSYNSVLMSDAVADIVSLTENGNHYLAMDRLYEILNYPLISSNAADDYYLNKAYLYMKQNMAPVIEDLISDTSLTAQNTLASYAGKLRAIQNKIIGQSQFSAIDYNTYFYTSLDKALLYRALHQHNDALQHLNNILSWSTPAFTDEVNKWLCLTQLEKDVLDSIVRKEDFFELKQLCESNMSLKMATNNTNDISQNDELQNESDILNNDQQVHEKAYISVTPNPVANQSVVETYIPDLENQAVIKVLDMLGKTVSTMPVTNVHSRTTISNSRLKEGIYYFVLIKDDEVLDKVRVVFMKE